MNNQNATKLFPEENMTALPFMFQFGEPADVVVSRTAGEESEYWTEQYKMTDTD